MKNVPQNLLIYSFPMASFREFEPNTKLLIEGSNNFDPLVDRLGMTYLCMVTASMQLQDWRSYR